jgi:GNAT superfamily N-acetyltransferase
VDLFVDPDRVRCGIARQLMTVLVDEAASSGASAGFVTVGGVQTRFRVAPRLRLTLVRSAE